MGSSVVGAGAGDAYSYWQQTAAKGATSLSTAITGGSLTDSTLWAKRLVMQADPAGGAVRYRYDGGAPSGSSGHILTGGDSAVIEGHSNIRNLQIASNQVVIGTLLITAER